MKTRELLKIVGPYCDKIRKGRKHYICYPKDHDGTITISASSSDRNYFRQVFRQFRSEAKIIIKELEK